MSTRTLIILGLVTACLGGYISYQLNSSEATAQKTDEHQAKKTPATAEKGSQRPAFRLVDTEGVTRDISEWDGKVLVINFWATWCPPCRDEIPEFVHLQEKYAAEGIQFVGIAPEDAETVRTFATDFNINYPLLVGESDVIQISEDYGNAIGALPYTVIVDRRGRIAHQQRGPLLTEQAEMIILGLL